MPKKTKGKSARREAPAPGETAESRVLILLEDIQQKVNASNEGIASMRAELIARMDAQFESLKSRIDVLELAVRKNSEDIRKNSEDIADLRREVERLTQRVDRISERELPALEARVRAVEQRLMITP